MAPSISSICLDLGCLDLSKTICGPLALQFTLSSTKHTGTLPSDLPPCLCCWLLISCEHGFGQKHAQLLWSVKGSRQAPSEETPEPLWRPSFAYKTHSHTQISVLWSHRHLWHLHGGWSIYNHCLEEGIICSGNAFKISP